MYHFWRAPGVRLGWLLDQLGAGEMRAALSRLVLYYGMAVGGGWPVSPDQTTVFPQTMLVDYVRIYQAPDTSERFTYTFTDNFSGWKKVMAPFRLFERSAAQPADAPNDGLTLNEVWGFGLEFPTSPSAQVFYLDQFQLSKRIILPLIFMNASLQ